MTVVYFLNHLITVNYLNVVMKEEVMKSTYILNYLILNDMKTVSEAAKEYAEKAVPQFETPESVILTKAYNIGFAAGVEFAQQWHSVDDELPRSSGLVVIKDEYNIINSAFYEDGRFIGAFSTVKYWRPIEFLIK